LPFYTSLTSFGNRLCLFRFYLGAVTPAGKHHMVSLVDEPVQYPLCQHRIGEKRVPVFGRAVTGQHHGAGVVTLINQLIEVFDLNLSMKCDF